MTPKQWARVLLAGRDAAEQEQIAVQTQPGHLPGVVAVALSAMSREAQQIAEEIR
jgi:hypothetical protein